MMDSWVQGYLAQFRNFEFHRDQDYQETYLAGVRARGLSYVLHTLGQHLHDSDLETRCQVAKAILYIDQKEGLNLVLPLFKSRSKTVQWMMCNLMRDFGDDRAVPFLLHFLKRHRDPQIRSTSAGALGSIGSLQTVSALVYAEANDHEPDIHGHSASSVSKRAIDKIVIRALVRELEHAPEEAHMALQLPNDITIIGTITPLSYEDQEEIQPDQDTANSKRVYNSWGRIPSWVPYRDLPWHAYGASIIGYPVTTNLIPPFQIHIQLQADQQQSSRIFVFGYSEGNWIITTLYHTNRE